MIDYRIQLKKLLETIAVEGLKVKPNYPKTITSVPLITFFEINNASTNIKVRDSLSFQVDIWESNFEKVIDLMQEADRLILKLGFKRDYVSKDEDIIDASGYYRKTLRYSRYVDTRNNRLID